MDEAYSPRDLPGYHEVVDLALDALPFEEEGQYTPIESTKFHALYDRLRSRGLEELDILRMMGVAAFEASHIRERTRKLTPEDIHVESEG